MEHMNWPEAAVYMTALAAFGLALIALIIAAAIVATTKITYTDETETR